MTNIPAASAILGEPMQPTEIDGEESSRSLILDIYEGTLTRSLNERNAFEAAVRVYRGQKPGLPEEAARRAVANIICRKS
jgi:hypothetical protein